MKKIDKQVNSQVIIYHRLSDEIQIKKISCYSCSLSPLLHTRTLPLEPVLEEMRQDKETKGIIILGGRQETN